MITVDIGTIAADLKRLRGRSDRVVIEGAGGWLAPINEGESMADLARALESPVLMVVGLRLGCLNHAQLTRQAIAAAQVPFAGWIANRMGPAMEREAENLATLERRLGEPALAIVPHFAGEESALVLTDAAARLAATG